MVANKFLQDVQMEENVREASVLMCKSFHESVRKQSERLEIYFPDSKWNIWVYQFFDIEFKYLGALTWEFWWIYLISSDC